MARQSRTSSLPVQPLDTNETTCAFIHHSSRCNCAFKLKFYAEKAPSMLYFVLHVINKACKIIESNFKFTRESLKKWEKLYRLVSINANKGRRFAN